MNNTGVTVSDIPYFYVEKGIYEFNATLFVRGNYYFNIYLQDQVEGRFTKIKNSPFYLEVFPAEPSANYSSVSGSGVTKTIIGRVEEIDIQVRDIYNNEFNSSTYLDKLVYNVSVVCNNTDKIPVNLTSSHPKCNSDTFVTVFLVARFEFVYRLLEFYLNATVTI